MKWKVRVSQALDDNTTDVFEHEFDGTLSELAAKFDGADVRGVVLIDAKPAAAQPTGAVDEAKGSDSITIEKTDVGIVPPDLLGQ